MDYEIKNDTYNTPSDAVGQWEVCISKWGRVTYIKVGWAKDIDPLKFPC